MADWRLILIKVENVSMKFRKNGDNILSLKEFVIANIKKEVKYDDFWVFKDISFEVKKGEVVGIVGRNGAGKSTMLKIISGILEPTEGKVSLGGRVVPMLELGSGFDYDLTGRENIFLNGAILGYSEEFLKEKYDEILEFSELGEFIETPIRNYSSGMIMRLAFSIATIVQPEILIVDEILAVGDEAFQKKSKRKMLELMGGGTTVLFVSHSIAQIREMCNRVVWIENGKLKMQGDTKYVCDEYQKYINPVEFHETKQHKASDAPKNLSDVLFVYGDGDNAYDWRVTYAREQLLAGAVPSNEIYYKDLTLEVAKLYRVYIFVGCENTENIKQFIYRVKELNKTVLFDQSDCFGIGEVDPQVQLLGDVKSYCDGVIVSNDVLAKKYELESLNVITSPLSICEESVKYASWAMYDRDILPYQDTSEMSEEELLNYNRASNIKVNREQDKLRIGLLGKQKSNPQFIKVWDELKHILQKNSGVKIVFVGNQQELPSDAEMLSSQIICKPLVDMEDEERVLSEIDVLLLLNDGIDTVVQEWIKAALVKVPCVVFSDDTVLQGVNEKYVTYCQSVEDLERIFGEVQKKIQDKTYMDDIYGYVRKNHCSVYTGDRFAQAIRDKMNPNLIFLLPDWGIGGVNWTACRQAALMKKEGRDVLLFVLGQNHEDIMFDGVRLPVVSKDLVYSYLYMDCAVAFEGDLARWLQNYTNVGRRYFFVSGFETDYYDAGNIQKLRVNQMFTPHTNMKFLTNSLWVKQWLKQKYRQDSQLLQDKVEFESKSKVQKQESNKCKILLVGEYQNQEDGLKEIFSVVNSLEQTKFEICFYSYGRLPVERIRYDALYQDLTQEEELDVFRECDILLLASRARSNERYALQMMAASGVVVACKDETISDLLIDGDNCVLYEKNEVMRIGELISKIYEDEKLRETLITNGLQTVESYSLKNSEIQVKDIYKIEN